MSINSEYPDFCNDINPSDSDRFFFTVNHFSPSIGNAHIAFSNVNLTVIGENLAGVVEIKS